MKRQEMFDRVVIGLIEQGKPSMNGSCCVYRNDEGLKCGIGMLIPDEKYDPSLEGNTASHKCILEAAGIRANNKVFADELQGLHDDNSHKGDRFIHYLYNDALLFARNYGLVAARVTEAYEKKRV